MINRDFRIAEITRKEINYNNAAFQTKDGPSSFYSEAASLAYKYNQEMKKSNKDFTYISSGKLHASATLHYIYQIILTYLLGDDNDDFFKRRIATVSSNKELKSALDFFSKEFPSFVKEDNK